MNSNRRKEKVVASKHGTHAIVILVHNVGNFNNSQMTLHLHVYVLTFIMPILNFLVPAEFCNLCYKQTT